MISRKKVKKISIAIAPDISKKLEEGNYNKSKLIDSLLKKYFTENIKKLV